MISQMENRKVWYYSKDTESLRCIANVIPIVELQIDVVKMITIRKCGAVEIFAVRNSQIDLFFKGHNRVATKKQLQKGFERAYRLLDGDTSGFVSKWEELL